MSHGLTEKDTMFSVRETPWHGLGVVVKKPVRTVEKALELAGVDWEVEQRPVLIPNKAGTDTLDISHSYVANVRADTGDVVGVVSPAYTVVQNREAFAFLGELLGGDVEFETGGSLRRQRRIWALARLPEHIEIGGDAVSQYMLIENRHDGYGAVTANATPVRVVCQNTLNLAIGRAQRSYSLRHVGDPTSRIYDARRALGVTVDYGKALKEYGDKLALEKISEKRLLDRVLLELYPDGGTDRQAANAQEARDAILGLYRDGDTAGNAPGTKWAAANALLEYRDWYRPVRGEANVFTRAMTDSQRNRTVALVAAA